MTRCANCYGVIAKDDLVCYTCGDALPKELKKKALAAKKAKQPITAFSNILFIASLGLTAFSFLSSYKLPLTITIALSAGLFLLRFADPARRRSSQQAEMEGPVMPIHSGSVLGGSR